MTATLNSYQRSSTVGGQYKSSAPTLADGDTIPVQIDVNGNLKTTASVTIASLTPPTAGFTDTAVALTAATSISLLAATAGLKSVTIMNIGLNPVTITNGSGAAAVGSGINLDPASGTGNQGGSFTYPVAPTNAIKGISTLGTTVIVTVGA